MLASMTVALEIDPSESAAVSLFQAHFGGAMETHRVSSLTGDDVILLVFAALTRTLIIEIARTLREHFKLSVEEKRIRLKLDGRVVDAEGSFDNVASTLEALARQLPSASAKNEQQ